MLIPLDNFRAFSSIIYFEFEEYRLFQLGKVSESILYPATSLAGDLPNKELLHQYGKKEEERTLFESRN